MRAMRSGYHRYRKLRQPHGKSWGRWWLAAQTFNLGADSPSKPRESSASSAAGSLDYDRRWFATIWFCFTQQKLWIEWVTTSSTSILRKWSFWDWWTNFQSLATTIQSQHEFCPSLDTSAISTCEPYSTNASFTSDRKFDAWVHDVNEPWRLSCRAKRLLSPAHECSRLVAKVYVQEDRVVPCCDWSGQVVRRLHARVRRGRSAADIDLFPQVPLRVHLWMV